jgi:uncharacterized protein (UPF0218 family)
LLVINRNLRKYLWHPKGVVYRGIELENILNEIRVDIVATIGDYVTAKYIEITGEAPTLAFIDGKTLRKEDKKSTYERIISDSTNVFKIHSPPGFIPIESILENLGEVPALIASKEKVLVLVDGEEDLMVFIVPYMVPPNTRYWVIYGQPGMGSVILRSDQGFLTLVSAVLNRMDLQVGAY